MMGMRQIHKTREDWLEARLGGVGASEVAGVLGISRFQSPWSVWQKKVDRVVDQGHPSPEAEAGYRLEPMIADWFLDVCDDGGLPTEYEIYDPGDYTMFWAEGAGGPLFATPDRLIEAVREADDNETPFASTTAILELKGAWYDQAKRFRREFPMEYRCQVQVQMHCTGLRQAYYAVLLNGMELVWFKEEYNEPFISAATRKVEQFWGHVESRTPPPEDFSDATSRAIAAHYDSPEETVVELPRDLAGARADRASLSARISELDRQKQAIGNRIKAALGNHNVGVLPDGTLWTWRRTVKGNRVLRPSTRSDDD